MFVELAVGWAPPKHLRSLEPLWDDRSAEDLEDATAACEIWVFLRTDDERDGLIEKGDRMTRNIETSLIGHGDPPPPNAPNVHRSSFNRKRWPIQAGPNVKVACILIAEKIKVMASRCRATSIQCILISLL